MSASPHTLRFPSLSATIAIHGAKKKILYVITKLNEEKSASDYSEFMAEFVLPLGKF